jgi:hypothetical protein
LAAGDYKLTASRAGFVPILSTFSIQPAAESEKSLDLRWVALPTQLRVALTSSGGMLKVDNTSQPVEGSEFKTELKDGVHSLQWGSSDKEYLEIQFEVKQTAVTLAKPAFKGSPGVSGMAAALSRNSVSFFAINLNGGITKTIDGQSQALGSDGSFDISRGQTVSFSATRFSGRTLGDLYADPGGQPAIYMYLIPPSVGRPSGAKRTQVSEPAQGKAPEASLPSIPAQSPAPPKVSDSELKEKQELERRERLRQKLGISK